jgi:RNA polymerase sigma factor (TIGR02999 family)
MTGGAPHEITDLLRAWGEGDDHALEALVPKVYPELRRRARRCLQGERVGHTLESAALIHEAWMRLAVAPADCAERTHFFAIAARLMRQILVDHARTRGRRKRGGSARRVTLDETALVSPEPDAELLDLDRALDALARLEPRKARVVELRYFGGLDVEETAVALGVSVRTVKRDWRLAKLWLLREIRSRSSG